MSEPRNNPDFKTTQWNLVHSLRESDTFARRQSLSELCELYWYPLFAYIRRNGVKPDDAADYVQGFFSELLDAQFLGVASPDQGRFRWFLMSAIKRYVNKQSAKQNAIKRGGGRTLLSIDTDDAEKRYQREPIDGWTAEKLFDRRWALQTIERALQSLRDEQAAKGKLALYDALQMTLTGARIEFAQYQTIGEQFSMSPGAVKVAALRLREKYRQALQAAVRDTIADGEGVDDELDQLLAALRGQ